jgi:LPXTG-motif cell wall-anchored protein
MKNWTQSTGFKLPSSPRHGTVLPITQAEYDRVLRKYLPAELVDSTEAVTARTPAGTAPKLPATVAVTFADGTTKQTAVTWDDLKPADYAAAGTFVVQGTIKESGTVRARATVTVFTPDSANAGDDGAGVEGAAILLTGVSAGEGAVAWSYQPGAGVDEGAACTFADPASAATTITCTDDGRYDVTLKVGEVTDTATVKVSNAGPQIGAVTAPATVETDQKVAVSAAVSDPGSNDKLTCKIAWGDGTSAAGVIADGKCTGEHAYPDAKEYDAVITVADDDDGTTTAGLHLVVELPASASAGPDAGGTEGAAIALTGAVVGKSAPKWTYRAGKGVDDGATCEFADPQSAVTTFTCTDDGEFEVTLTAGALSDTAKVTVRDAAPEIVEFTAPAGAIAGKPFPIKVRFTDPGKNDKHRCVAHFDEDLKVTAKDGACTFEHTYRAAGTYRFAVSVKDDEVGVSTGFHTIVVAAADHADAGPAATGAEGAAIQLTGLTTGSGGAAWSYRPLSGVDTGAACSFADPKKADTTITCTDDGTYEVLLKSGKASGKTQLTVINEIPVITAAADPAPVKAGKPVSVSATFTDAGQHDTHTCTVDWNGGQTSKGSVAGGTCTAGHTYAKAGTYQVKVTVADDDGGAVSRTVKVVVKAAGGGGGSKVTIPGVGDLPLTGSPVAAGAGIGLLLMVGGVVLLVLSRRRKIKTQV